MKKMQKRWEKDIKRFGGRNLKSALVGKVFVGGDEVARKAARRLRRTRGQVHQRHGQQSRRNQNGPHHFVFDLRVQAYWRIVKNVDILFLQFLFDISFPFPLTCICRCIDPGANGTQH
jgi:hypothetical protein